MRSGCGLWCPGFRDTHAGWHGDGHPGGEIVHSQGARQLDLQLQVLDIYSVHVL